RIGFSGPFPISVRRVPRGWKTFNETVLEYLLSSRENKRGPIPAFIKQLQSAIASTQHATKEGIGESPADLLGHFVGQTIEQQISRCTQALMPLWDQLRYLGPLREQPRRYYQFDDTGGIDIGVNGEFTIQVLALEANKAITSSSISYG